MGVLWEILHQDFGMVRGVGQEPDVLVSEFRLRPHWMTSDGKLEEAPSVQEVRVRSYFDAKLVELSKSSVTRLDADARNLGMAMLQVCKAIGSS